MLPELIELWWFFSVLITKKLRELIKIERKLQKTDLTSYNLLLIVQNLWQVHYKISLIIWLKKFIKFNPNTTKPVYSGHLQFLKKVSAITRCPIYRVLDFLGKKRQHKLRWRDFFIRYEKQYKWNLFKI